MFSSAPAKPLAVWHDLNFSGYLVSELGPITGTPLAEVGHHHCTNRDFYTVMHQSLGRCVLFNTTLLAELDAGSCRYQNLHASRHADFVDLHVDHVVSNAAQTNWTDRLLRFRWRNTDPP